MKIYLNYKFKNVKYLHWMIKKMFHFQKNLNHHLNLFTFNFYYLFKN